MDEKLRGAVIELIRVHRFNEAQIICHGGELRESIRDPSSALAVLLELKLRAEHFRNTLDKGELLAFKKLFGAILAIEFFQFRLVVEKFVLGWRAGHVEVDDALGLAGEQRHGWHKWLGGIFGQLGSTSEGRLPHSSEPHGAEAGGAFREEMATGELREFGDA